MQGDLGIDDVEFYQPASLAIVLGLFVLIRDVRKHHR